MEKVTFRFMALGFVDYKAGLLLVLVLKHVKMSVAKWILETTPAFLRTIF